MAFFNATMVGAGGWSVRGKVSVLHGLGEVYPFDLKIHSFLCHQLVHDSHMATWVPAPEYPFDCLCFQVGENSLLSEVWEGMKSLRVSISPGKRLAESYNGLCGRQSSKVVPKIPAPGLCALHNPLVWGLYLRIHWGFSLVIMLYCLAIKRSCKYNWGP